MLARNKKTSKVDALLTMMVGRVLLGEEMARTLPSLPDHLLFRHA